MPDERLFNVCRRARRGRAAKTGKTVPQVALNWLLQRPTVSTVIIGARNEEQLRQNLAAADWKLSADQVAKLDAASEVTRPIRTGTSAASRNATRRRCERIRIPGHWRVTGG